MRFITIHFFIVFMMVVFASGGAFAQFNDTITHYINFNTSGSINKTNDGNTYLLNNGLKFNVKKKAASVNFTNNWIYGKQNTSLTNNDFSSVLDFNLYKTFPHFFYWGLANYNTSFSLKINKQILAGLGVAYNLIDKKNARLNISDGVLYDQSDLLLPNGTPDIYHTYRNSFRLSYRFAYKDIVSFNGTHFLQNSFSSGSDYIIRSHSDLTFKLNKWLGLTTVLEYNRQNRTQSDNLLFTYGLTLEKYFK